MKCLYIADWECHARETPVEACKFCLEARTRWISSLKHIEYDYHKNLQELNQLREEKRKLEEMPR